MKQDPDTVKQRPTSDQGAKPSLDDADIPTLSETVEDDSTENVEAAEDAAGLPVEKQAFREREIATLEAIVFDGANPGEAKDSPQKATADNAKAAASTDAKQPSPETQSLAPGAGVFTQTADTPIPRTSNNPFLPQHILDRLNHGRRNLVEEIAQSGAALDASTAMIRARSRPEHAPAHPSEEHKPRAPGADDKIAKSSARQKQLIDDLVEEYLPLLAAELRKRLKAELDKEINKHAK